MPISEFNEADFTFKAAFENDPDIQQYASNSLMLFALSLYLRIDDLQEFASNSVTASNNDKKVDLCHFDEEEGRVVIVQAYISQTWGRKSAPGNKASDLNTGIAWLFSTSEDRIPESLKAKAIELRRAIITGDVRQIELIYVHNCYESTNVSDELKVAADATRDIVKSLGGSLADQIIFSCREFGLNTIEELYRTRDTEILVDDWLDVPTSAYFEEQGDGWKAIVTSIPGDWIRQLYTLHRDRLFSANFRDYLGTVNRKENINREIKQTAVSEPVNFWVYNNGITALTHQLDIVSGRIRIRGISIINGAQTSGALGESSEKATKSIKVLCRIVEGQPQGLINKIILFNNTQNEIKPADRRSNHPIQSKLREDFAKHNIPYVHRRSSTRAPRNAISAASIATALCAFHGDPQTAFRNAKDIFNDDAVYNKVFRGNITAEHVYLVQTLSNAIDIIKSQLKDKIASETATQLEQQEYEVLKYSSAKHFMLFAIGYAAEEIIKRRISDLYEWKCKSQSVSVTGRRVSEAWSKILHVMLPQIATLAQNKSESVYDIQRSSSLSTQLARELKALIASLEPVIGVQFNEVRSITTL